MNNILLNNGVKIPQIGFGTWKAPTSEVTINAVKTAIENGYTHIDCASVYGNEKEVGQGIIASNISRDKLFITGKLWNDIRGYDETITAFNQTLNDLAIDYLDLYLIHWPDHKNTMMIILKKTANHGKLWKIYINKEKFVLLV